MRDTIAKNIKLFRVERGWSQKELASKAGISASVMCQIEHGRPVGQESLIKVSIALNINIHQLTAPNLRVQEGTCVNYVNIEYPIKDLQ